MHTSQRHTGSRIWYSGATLPNGTTEEFSESCIFPIRNLSNTSSRSEEDAHFSYCIADIDQISCNLGIPWETSKDQPFANLTIYIGFTWDLKKRMVALSEAKVEKYLKAINDWLARPNTPSNTCRNCTASYYMRPPSYHEAVPT